MAKLSAIADTGVLVGLISQKDQWHKWTVEQARKLAPPFLTCEAVITETCFLLQGVSGGEQKVLGMLADGYLKIEFSLSEEAAQVKALIKKYADIPMSLADACLVRMSERNENASIFTVDSDFLIYRQSNKKIVPLIYPEK